MVKSKLSLFIYCLLFFLIWFLAVHFHTRRSNVSTSFKRMLKITSDIESSICQVDFTLYVKNSYIEVIVCRGLTVFLLESLLQYDRFNLLSKS